MKRGLSKKHPNYPAELRRHGQALLGEGYSIKKTHELLSKAFPDISYQDFPALTTLYNWKNQVINEMPQEITDGD